MQLVTKEGKILAKIGLAMKRIPPCDICGENHWQMYGYYHPETKKVLASACMHHWYSKASEIGEIIRERGD